MAYATTDDLQDYVPTVPDNAALLLDRASTLVDYALRSAVYEVDEDGQPTDDDVIDALMQATCEQVAAWVGSGEDGTGSADQYASVSIGSVSLSRASGEVGNSSSAVELCPQARMVLDNAGLTGREPWTW